MKNREHLRDQAQIDMLLEMNEGLLEKQKGICVLDSFMDSDTVFGRCSGTDHCRECVSKWLNEEVK